MVRTFPLLAWTPPWQRNSTSPPLCLPTQPTLPQLFPRWNRLNPNRLNRTLTFLVATHEQLITQKDMLQISRWIVSRRGIEGCLMHQDAYSTKMGPKTVMQTVDLKGKPWIRDVKGKFSTSKILTYASLCYWVYLLCIWYDMREILDIQLYRMNAYKKYTKEQEQLWPIKI